MARGRGRLPGSDLDLVRRQRLDEYGVDYGILNSLGLLNCHERPELAAAIAGTLNDWMWEWLESEPRLLGAIVVPHEYGVDYGILNSLGLLNCHERPELPALLWRFDKDWKGLWHEIPWVKEPPSTYVRRNFRVMSARAKRYCTATRPSSTR